MKSQLTIAVAGIAFAVAAFGFATAGRLSSFPAAEAGSASLRLAGLNGSLANQIYCHDGETRQYSKLHRGWVCLTELGPRAAN